LQQALTSLADATAVAPPAALKQRVLATLAADRAPLRDVVTLKAPFRSRVWMMPALAAAAVVILAVSIGLVRATREQSRLSEQLAQRQADVTRLQERIASYAGQTDLALSILTAADTREIAMAGRENAAGSAARAYWSPTRGLLVVADRLPDPPPGRVYQVWMIENGQPVSAGLLGSQGGSRGMLIVAPPRPGVGTTVTVAVTDEPPGGLSAPSGTIRLAGSA